MVAAFLVGIGIVIIVAIGWDWYWQWFNSYMDRAGEDIF
jgi:hypothetical protein